MPTSLKPMPAGMCKTGVRDPSFPPNQPFLTPQASCSHPAIKNKPPTGVKGPTYLSHSIPVEALMVKIYNDPLKKAMPTIKQAQALISD